ncbi:MAG TPA: DinB family protein [Ignavibacteria bacterium]|nr:DinB family protein [Ignavibacteria bacterium]
MPLKILPDEYPEYYKIYVDLVKDYNILDTLGASSTELQNLLKNISDEDADKSYAFGKWTIKEIVGHLLDTERIFTSRALRIARGDRQRLPGFEQEDYVKNAKFFQRKLDDLIQELLLVRASDLMLFRSFDDVDLMQRGYVSDYEVTVNGILYILAGHELHHINVIRTLYLPFKK